VKNLAVARRYARALLLIGKEDGQAETYREELDGFSGLIAKDRSLEQAICNPLYDAAGRKKVLQTIAEQMELSGVMKAFLLLIFAKGRVGFMNEIGAF